MPVGCKRNKPYSIALGLRKRPRVAALPEIPAAISMVFGPSICHIYCGGLRPLTGGCAVPAGRCCCAGFGLGLAFLLCFVRFGFLCGLL